MCRRSRHLPVLPTIQLAFASPVISVATELLGVCANLSFNRIVRRLVSVRRAIVRGVPDLGLIARVLSGGRVTLNGIG